MRKNEKRSSVEPIRNHTSTLIVTQHEIPNPKVTLENLAADNWGKSLKRGIYSYQMKELHGSNTPKNIIKIEDLDVRLVGTIKEKKSGLENQISNAPEASPDPARKNILVIATHGPPFKCAVAGERADSCLLSENLVEITLNPDVPAAYVAAYLNSVKGQKEFEKHRTGSTQFARITDSNLKLFEIPLPHDAACQSVYKWFEHLYQYELELNRERDALSRIATGILQNIGSEPAE
ncbi:MAG: hypothetical protein Q7V05_11680 [Methanoregula sp.]|nr:hypothetical protein [Methanoregula sp.]